ncbi:cytochrome b562 [Vibrio agarivorans]|uniref:cytochrome b562 n=1 Tax=Vibrio agarivorans TaxID=153622 RepID=UPI0025B4AA44|nr:cytochrome b562 [Vibrio agarivorans]MDN3659649.1 cytochrome b562 [Vibrio agarivorans]
MKHTAVAALLVMSFSLSAGEFDLKANMQEMRLSFKQAAEAASVDEMQAPIAQLSKLIQASKGATYPEEKSQLYMEGFKRLSYSVVEVQQHLTDGNFEQAQQSLRQIDELRIEYHDKRNPSIWQRLFGKA